MRACARSRVRAGRSVGRAIDRASERATTMTAEGRVGRRFIPCAAPQSARSCRPRAAQRRRSSPLRARRTHHGGAMARPARGYQQGGKRCIETRHCEYEFVRGKESGTRLSVAARSRGLGRCGARALSLASAVSLSAVPLAFSAPTAHSSARSFHQSRLSLFFSNPFDLALIFARSLAHFHFHERREQMASISPHNRRRKNASSTTDDSSTTLCPKFGARSPKDFQNVT